MKDTRYSWYVRNCCPSIGRKQNGKILRTLVIVSNILYWFAGCTIFSIAIWLRFIDVGAKNYFSTFHPFDAALYVVLVASILFLVAAFVGTCAANTKNEMMISLYITVIFVVSVAEIISLIIYSSNHNEIEQNFSKWYKSHFENYQSSEKIHNSIVNHVQTKLECCGLSGQHDFLVVFGIEKIPNSCFIQIKKTGNILRPEVYKTGCVTKLTELITWLLKGWPVPFAATVILLLQMAGITTSSLFLQHLIYRRTFGSDDGEIEDLITSKSNLTDGIHSSNAGGKLSVDDLPRPKLYRVLKSPGDPTFGFDVGYDDERLCYTITDVTPDSNAEFAGMTLGSQVIEINGMLLQDVDQAEVDEKIESISNELLIVAIDEETEKIYKTNKVSVNLRNIEGVTGDNKEYRPRFCSLNKSTQGFGFHLLYLEDRKGEYIEEVAPGSPGHKAGLNVGDRIIDVNGVNIEREKSSDVVKRIRACGNVVSLLVVDPKTDGYYRKKGVSLTASLSIDFFKGRTPNSVVLPVKKNRKNKKDVKPRYCRLVKSENEDFGLYVVIDNNRIGQVIRWVDCGGPADRAGLRIGDRIIEVNGHSVEYESHQKLISCISLNKTLSHFIVVDEEYDHLYQRNKPRLCRIFKETCSLGFCVLFDENKEGHYIDVVDVGGPAQRAGLQVFDRIIQIDGSNIEKESHQAVLTRLRSCETDVVILVIDSLADKHYERIMRFKSREMKNIEYDTISFEPEEPLFLAEDDNLSVTSGTVSIGVKNESISIKGSQSKMGSLTNLLGDNPYVHVDHRGYKECTVKMAMHERRGFSVLMDRDRNGFVIKELEDGGPGDRAGLKDGDRIISINSKKVNNLSHEEVLRNIIQSGRRFVLSVVDELSDDVAIKHRPYLFRLLKAEGGYGFYLWHDHDGHYVEEVTIGSPADSSGMRSGDRIIEVNGVNVEEETHEEVFYRVKASMNAVTLLAVNQKTFRLYKKHQIPVSVLKAESNFSSEQSQNTEPMKKNEDAQLITREIELYREPGEDFGFNLAFSNSFIGNENTGSHVVHWVDAGGAAYIAGLRDGDKIVEIEGVDVRNQEHDHVIEQIYQVGKQRVLLTIEYEEQQDANMPHSITIRKMDNSFGFHLWFDQNGHYIEDVTIGSASDIAGLKIGDRVIKVNGKDVENLTHAEVVSRVRNSDEQVSITVFSVQTEGVTDAASPTVFTLTKEKGTFGFTISQDDQGFHFDYVAAESPAGKFGINIGDRLLEVNGESVAEIAFSELVRTIRSSGKTVRLTVMSSAKTSEPNRVGMEKDHDTPFSNQIFNELTGKDKIDYVVESKGFELYGKSNDGSEEMVSNYSNLSQNVMETGQENPAYVNDREDNIPAHALDNLMGDDVKGRFMDENLLSQAYSQATMKRRKPGKNIYAPRRRFAENRPVIERRKRNLQDIENKLSHTLRKTKPRVDNEHVEYTKRKYEKQQPKTPKERRFRLVTSKKSLQEKWNFEQSDSRRPYEIDNAHAKDSKIEEYAASEDANAENIPSIDNEIYDIEEECDSSEVDQQDEKINDDSISHNSSEENFNTNEYNELNSTSHNTKEDAEQFLSSPDTKSVEEKEDSVKDKEEDGVENFLHHGISGDDSNHETGEEAEQNHRNHKTTESEELIYGQHDSREYEKHNNQNHESIECEDLNHEHHELGEYEEHNHQHHELIEYEDQNHEHHETRGNEGQNHERRKSRENEKQNQRHHESIECEEQNKQDYESREYEAQNSTCQKHMSKTDCFDGVSVTDDVKSIEENETGTNRLQYIDDGISVDNQEKHESGINVDKQERHESPPDEQCDNNDEIIV